jgi:hypothetical protein
MHVKELLNRQWCKEVSLMNLDRNSIVLLFSDHPWSYR